MATKGQSRVHLTIYGRVQGVCFRAGTLDRARELNVTGWVSNLPDGSVEVVAEGPMHALQELIVWCRQGPSGSHVIRIDVRDEMYEGEFDHFQVKY
ncbi:MAG: acylphosphatase [Deltaproteobacteria bacterium]|nr:acylphosphatase [Deltaproteobacteria bacterium]